MSGCLSIYLSVLHTQELCQNFLVECFDLVSGLKVVPLAYSTLRCKVVWFSPKWGTCRHNLTLTSGLCFFVISTDRGVVNRAWLSQLLSLHIHNFSGPGHWTWTRDVSGLCCLHCAFAVTHWCVSAQEVKGQGRVRPKVDLEAWRRHHSWPPWVE